MINYTKEQIENIEVIKKLRNDNKEAKSSIKIIELLNSNKKISETNIKEKIINDRYISK